MELVMKKNPQQIWKEKIVREEICIAKAPKQKHSSIRKIDSAMKRMRRFQSSKASKKARWKKCVSRWWDRF